VKNSTAPAVKRKPERIRVMSPSRGFNLMSTPCYNSLMVVLTGANDHDCSSDLRQMSAKRPWHFISRRLGDPDVSCAAPSLSQRRDQKLLLYFKGGGSADNFSTEPANNRNFGRGMWREAVQRSDYPSVSRPCRFWQLRAGGLRRIPRSCRTYWSNCGQSVLLHFDLVILRRSVFHRFTVVRYSKTCRCNSAASRHGAHCLRYCTIGPTSVGTAVQSIKRTQPLQCRWRSYLPSR
jgi:hypothetical protein